MNGESRNSVFSKVVVALLLVCTFAVLMDTAVGFTSFRDSAYPDSATLFRLGNIARHGQIYPDTVDKPPYYVTLYGPLFYLILALPFRAAQILGSHTVAVERLTVFTFFCCSIVLIFLNCHKLSQSRRAAWFSVLFALSAFVVGVWTTPIRPDFLGLSFALLGLYCFLLLENRPYVILLSAIPAGLAPLVKQTFIALPIAIVCWLIFRLRFKEALYWAAVFALVAGGGYALVWMHEPFMREHLAALGHPILEFNAAFRLISDALTQPMIPFAVTGAMLVFWRGKREQLLVFFYGFAAWLIGFATIPQAGGGINYLFEPLWISAILAGQGLMELDRVVSETPRPARVLVYILLLGWFGPFYHVELWDLQRSAQAVKLYRARKVDFQRFASFVKGHRFLSTYSDLTILSSQPEVPDPLLNLILQKGGHWNYRPVIADLDKHVFEFAVVKQDLNATYRGTTFWDDSMIQSLHTHYRLACVFQDMNVWLPTEDHSGLLPKFEALGCKAAKPTSISPNQIDRSQ